MPRRFDLRDFLRLESGDPAFLLDPARTDTTHPGVVVATGLDGGLRFGAIPSSFRLKHLFRNFGVKLIPFTSSATDQLLASRGLLSIFASRFGSFAYLIACTADTGQGGSFSRVGSFENAGNAEYANSGRI